MLVSAVQQKWISSTCTYVPPSWASLPPSLHPTFLVIPEHGTELSVLHSFPVAIYSHTVVCIYINPSLPIHSTPSPPCQDHSLLSMSASLLLTCKYFHLYHFSRVHICVLVQYLCFSFWLPSLCLTVPWSIHISTDKSNFIPFLRLSNIPLYLCTTSSCVLIHLTISAALWNILCCHPI